MMPLVVGMPGSAGARRAGRHAINPRLGELDADFELFSRQSGQLLPFTRLGLGDSDGLERWSRIRWFRAATIYLRLAAMFPATCLLHRRQQRSVRLRAPTAA